jgi:hypothetical protein
LGYGAKYRIYYPDFVKKWQNCNEISFRGIISGIFTQMALSLFFVFAQQTRLPIFTF